LNSNKRIRTGWAQTQWVSLPVLLVTWCLHCRSIFSFARSARRPSSGGEAADLFPMGVCFDLLEGVCSSLVCNRESESQFPQESLNLLRTQQKGPRVRTCSAFNDVVIVTFWTPCRALLFFV
jgi:hypothetical protein